MCMWEMPMCGLGLQEFPGRSDVYLQCDCQRQQNINTFSQAPAASRTMRWYRTSPIVWRASRRKPWTCLQTNGNYVNLVFLFTHMSRHQTVVETNDRLVPLSNEEVFN